MLSDNFKLNFIKNSPFFINDNFLIDFLKEYNISLSDSIKEKNKEESVLYLILKNFITNNISIPEKIKKFIENNIYSFNKNLINKELCYLLIIENNININEYLLKTIPLRFKEYLFSFVKEGKDLDKILKKDDYFNFIQILVKENKTFNYVNGEHLLKFIKTPKIVEDLCIKGWFDFINKDNQGLLTYDYLQSLYSSNNINILYKKLHNYFKQNNLVDEKKFLLIYIFSKGKINLFKSLIKNENFEDIKCLNKEPLIEYVREKIKNHKYNMYSNSIYINNNVNNYLLELMNNDPKKFNYKNKSIAYLFNFINFDREKELFYTNLLNTINKEEDLINFYENIHDIYLNFKDNNSITDLERELIIYFFNNQSLEKMYGLANMYVNNKYFNHYCNIKDIPDNISISISKILSDIIYIIYKDIKSISVIEKKNNSLYCTLNKIIIKLIDKVEPKLHLMDENSYYYLTHIFKDMDLYDKEYYFKLNYSNHLKIPKDTSDEELKIMINCFEKHGFHYIFEKELLERINKNKLLSNSSKKRI